MQLVEVAHQSDTEINSKWNRKLKALGMDIKLVDIHQKELAKTLEKSRLQLDVNTTHAATIERSLTTRIHVYITIFDGNNSAYTMMLQNLETIEQQVAEDCEKCRSASAALANSLEVAQEMTADLTKKAGPSLVSTRPRR